MFQTIMDQAASLIIAMMSGLVAALGWILGVQSKAKRAMDRAEAAEGSIKTLEGRMTEQEKVLNTHLVAFGKVETNIDHIQEDISEINTTLSKLLERVSR